MDDVQSSGAEASSPSAGPSSSSSASSDDFLAEPLGALRRVIFNAFATREDPVDFIAKFNSLQNSGLVPVELRPEVTVQALIDVGCATNECHPLLFAYLDALLECQHFDFIFYVLALTSYRDLRKPECVASFAEKIGCLLRVVDCDFRDDHALHNFCDTYVTALQWFLSLLWEIADQRLEQAVFLAKPLVDHVHFFARDHTAKFVLFYTNFLAAGECRGEGALSVVLVAELFAKMNAQVREISEKLHEMSKTIQIPREIRDRVDSLIPLVQSLPSRPDFSVEFVETYRFGLSQPRPAILTLVSIFAYFRVGMKNEEMADAISNMGEIMLMSRTQVISDLFRGSFLGLLEGNAALPLERQPLGEVFMYKRVVRVAEIMVETGQCSVEELHQALIKLVSNSALLNALDQRQMENTFATVFEGSKISEFLSEDQYANLTTIRVNNITKHEKRMKDDKDYVSPFPNGCVMDNACHPRSRFRLFLRADRTAAKIIGNTGPIDPLAVELVDCADVELVDLILGCLCAENNKIKSFSGFLSTLTNKLEQSDGSDTSTRVQLFDSAFLLLSRIRQIFCDLRLDEMTDNVTTSTFYKWTEKYKEHFDKGQLLPVNEEIKQSTFMSHFARLKLGQAFWNEGWNFEHLLAHAPAIGEAILDEIRAHEGSKVDEEAISNILSTFGGVTSMFLCLCQWLETNPLSDPVQQLAQGLRDVSRKLVEQYDAHPADGDPILQRQQKRWKFTIQLVTPTLNRIIHGPRARENVYTWLVNCARRELPVLDPTELPHMKKLKHAFYFAMQQGWASPDVVMYLDRMNKNIKHEQWLKCWLIQMSKLITADELESAAELCISASITAPVVCLLALLRMIIEEQVFDRNNTGFNHTWVLARMLVRVMLVCCWAEDRRRDTRRRFLEWRKETKKRKATSELSAGDLSAESSLLSAPSATNSPPEETAAAAAAKDSSETVYSHIRLAFQRFFKEVKPSIVRPKVAFIACFMQELAMTPAGDYRQRLIELVPDEMMFALVRLEPTCFNVPFLMKFYDMNNVDHRLLTLQIVCMLRKFHLE